MLGPRISGCQYYFLLIVASGLTHCCGSSFFFFLSIPCDSSGTCPMKQKTCLKDLQASRPFLCLIICAFGLLINAYLYSWVSHKSCLLTPWDWSAQVRGGGLGATPPPLVFNSRERACCLPWVQADTFLPYCLSFSNSSTEWSKPIGILSASITHPPTPY